MSASNKKQLRKEQSNNMLTAKQREEQAEAKKLKAYTLAFIAVMVIIALVAIGSLIYRGVSNSGMIQRNAIAAEVNGEQINSVMMNYYYTDAINEMIDNVYTSFTTNYEDYLLTIGLDITKPLDQQTNPETGETWAQYFLSSALDSAKHDYAMAQAAKENGYELPEDIQAEVDSQIYNLEINAQAYGYSGADTYLRLIYGTGADAKSYTTYLTQAAIAEAYYNHYMTTLTYDQTQRDEHAKDKLINYNSYDYSYVYISYNAFLETKEDNATHTEEEKNAARAAAKKLAEELMALGNLDAIRDKVATIENTSITVKDIENELYTNATTKLLSDWVSAEGRKAGEVGLVENKSVATEDEEAVVNGYYVICFTKSTDNTAKMSNVRHLLVAFEGGEEDEISGEMNYTVEQKEAAKAKAEKLLQQWKDSNGTEETFIQLVKDNTDDTASAETGGLYENINPASQYVSNFLAWSIDPTRQVGDTGIVETEYGYHIMYFSSYSELSYRDSLIEDELRAADVNAWHEALMEKATANLLDTSKLATDMIISK